jgi:hypothetical protein
MRPDLLSPDAMEDDTGGYQVTMSAQQAANLAYTIAHFKEIARQNRFAENSTIPHDTERCVICHPKLLPTDSFLTYLEVITPSILIRRPRLDQTLVDEINSDLELIGSSSRVSLNELLSEDANAMEHWSNWLRSAIQTGLQLLSVHSATSEEFDLDEAEANGWGKAIDNKIRELESHQKQDI